MSCVKNECCTAVDHVPVNRKTNPILKMFWCGRAGGAAKPAGYKPDGAHCEAVPSFS